MPSIFSVRGFRFYFAGQGLSFIGDGLRALAIPLLVYKLTGSALSLALTYALEFLPFSIFSLVGGSLADRLDRRRLMIACDFIRFAIIAFFALAYWRGFLTLPMLYAGIVLVSLTAAVFLGGQASSIPFLLGKDRATQAIAALSAAEQTSNIVVPPIGGLLFTLGGPLPALLVNAFTYLTSQISLALVPTMGPELPGGLPSLRDLLDDIGKGFRFLMSDRAMRTISFMSLAMNAIGTMAVAILIAFMKRELAATDAQVGLTLGLNAFGSIVGSMLAGWASRRWPFGPALCISFVIDGLIFLPIIFAHHLWVLVLFWNLTGLAASFESAWIVGWRIRVIPSETVGRVFGAARLVATIGIVPGALAAGYIGDHIGVRVAMAVSGFGFMVLALIAAALPVIRSERR